jgi:formylglycine-generating enzyme required for sulfatase activity
VELASHYEWDLDANLAAAEIGLPRAAFLEGLNRTAGLSRVMGQLANAGGTVQRAVFESHFPQLVDAFRVGAMLGPPPPAAPSSPPAPPGESEGELKNSIGMRLRRIQRGSFVMGSAKNAPLTADDEQPPHEVTISRPFFMGVFEVTREEFARVMGRQPPPANAKRLPVANVTRAEAVDFCRRLSSLPGEAAHGRVNYRLPTEAEWEYACRAGTTTAYPFAAGASLDDFAWYGKNSDDKAHPVGEKKANAWGLHDMLGNVAEDDYYRKGPRIDPTGPEQAVLRVVVLRGGSFLDRDADTRSAVRQHTLDDYRAAPYGFRVVLEIP